MSEDANHLAVSNGGEKNVSFNEKDVENHEGPALGERRGSHNTSGSYHYDDDGLRKSNTFAGLEDLNQSGENVGRLRRDTAIPLDFVIKHVKLNLDAGELYSDLMIFIPFLVMFVFFFLYGRQVESNFYVLKAVRDQMMETEFPNVESQVELFRQQVQFEQRLWIERDKRYLDIGNSGDWGDWLNDVVIGTIWDKKNPDTPHALLAPVAQNYHLGALRVRSIRMPSDSCDINPQIYPDKLGSENNSQFPRTCYGKHDRTKEDKERKCNATNPLTGKPMITYRENSDVPGVTISAVEGIYHAGGHQVEIPFNISYNQAKAIADVLTGDCGLVDNWGTRFVVVEFFIYTPQTDAFHGVKLYNEVLPGGWWYNQFMLRSFQVWTNARTNQSIFEIFFVLFVFYYWGAFFREMYLAHKTGSGVLKFFTEFWNILELTNLITFIAVFVLRIMWLTTSRSAADTGELKFPFKAQYPDHLDRLMGLYGAQVYANSVNTILTFLKLLKYVRLNARLSVLTRTIAMCQQSIIGVLVLFVFVIIGYGITAWTLFGINIEGFRNLGVAMSSLVRMLVGDIDYEAMRRENRFLAGVFFWSFIILALFLLLNFLIAIISEAFAKISGKAYSQSFDETLLRWFQHMKAILSPTNIKRVFRGICAGKGESKMMRIALDNLIAAKQNEEQALRDQLDLRRSQQEKDGGVELDYLDYDDIVVMMLRADWQKWIDPDVYETLGEFYFDYNWDDIMNEYDDAKKSSEEVGKRHMMDTVQNGVKKVVGDELKKVDQLDEMLTSLESELGSIIDALKR